MGKVLKHMLGLLKVCFKPKINDFSCILPKNLKTIKQQKIKQITMLMNYYMRVEGLECAIFGAY